MTSEPARDDASLHHGDRPTAERLDQAARVFQMLSDPTRLHLLWSLTHGPADVGTLVEQTGAARTSVSQHLSKLRLAGLVRTRKDGRRVLYSLPGGHLERLVQEGLNHADHQVTGEPHHG
ncbi:ArsR/SmtB family transcription factor [Solicola sp. PLA-1-18]|uniref:ArsR/SmtB family transcription factor n=1 Tax=Solicola sp. PLA-1-18 TaxID=3380532 RepID=UPI003B818319